MIFRFAPSPTGFLHLANARIALLNYVKSLQTNGKFILRLDDTDLERTKQEYIDQIFVDMKWFGIECSEVVRQSERYALYNEVMDDLKKQGVIYAAYETQQELVQMREKQVALKQAPRYKPIVGPESGRVPHWRFKLEDINVDWIDGIMGPMHFSGKQASDPVVLREDGTITYMLASLIDDYNMDVSHIVRGRDHISNTAVQLQMLHTLNKLKNTNKQMAFSHFPLISSLDGQVFSKRDGSFALKTFIEAGMDSIVVSRFLLNLGLAEPLLDKNLNELADLIDWNKYGRSDLKCDPEQIWHLNRKHISYMSSQDARKWLSPYNLSMINENNWHNVWEVIKYELDGVESAKVWQKVLNGEYDDGLVDKTIVKQVLDLIESMDVLSWEVIAAQILANNPGVKMPQLAKPIRLCLIGMEHGPKIGELCVLFGKTEVIKRLKNILY